MGERNRKESPRIQPSGFQVGCQDHLKTLIFSTKGPGKNCIIHMQNKAGHFQDMQKLTKNGQNPLKIKTMELLDEHIWGKDTKSDNVFIHDTKSTGSKGKNSKVVYVFSLRSRPPSAPCGLAACSLVADGTGTPYPRHPPGP